MTLSKRYGDLDLLRRQYHSMKAWVEHVKGICDDRRVWGDGFQFGDWVDPKAPPDAPADAQTDPSLVGTAWFARSAQILAEAAEVLGEPGDAAAYRLLADEVAAGFRAEFVAPNGRVVNDSQTAHLLALAFDLVTPEQRPATARRLQALIEKEGGSASASTGTAATRKWSVRICGSCRFDLTRRTSNAWWRRIGGCWGRRRKATLRFETPPERQMQIDFGVSRVLIGRENRTRAPVRGDAGLPPRTYAQAFTHQPQAAWFAVSRGRSTFRRGVAEDVLVDNAKAAGGAPRRAGPFGPG